MAKANQQKKLDHKTVADAAIRLQSLLIKRPFVLVKFSQGSLFHEVHADMWLTAEIGYESNSAHVDKNKLVIKADSRDGADRMVVEIVPPEGGNVLFGINFDGRTATFTVVGEQAGDIQAVYFIAAQDLEELI